MPNTCSYMRHALPWLMLILAGHFPVQAEPLGLAHLLRQPDGVIEEIETPYSHVVIYREGDFLAMAFRGTGGVMDQSRRNLADPRQLSLPYTRLMMAGLLYVEHPRKILMLGLGGGTMTGYLHRHFPQLSIQAVELDAGVIDAARRYFELSESDNYRVHTSDARDWLEGNPDRHDLILADVFQADSHIPYHLLTAEFFHLARERLAPAGWLVLNLHVNNRLFDATLATVRSVFTTVDTYLADGNAVLVAGTGPAPGTPALRARASELQDSHSLVHDLREVLAARADLAVRDATRILVDDFAPAGTDAAIKRHNRANRYPKEQ